MARGPCTTLTMILLAGSIGFALPGAAFAQSSAPSHFDIPAEDLGVALNRLAHQSAREIVFSAELVRGKRSLSLRGDFTTQEALDRLLQGSGLHGRVTENGSVVVEAADSRAELQPEDIIVTATKRPEAVRKISGSVSAFTNDQLQALGAQDMADYLPLTPGVVFNAAIPGYSSVAIRGVSTTTRIDQGQGTTGYFLNEVPLTDPYFSVGIPDIDAFDVDNVTILRGPQGTLFGSASLGGAINYQAAKPQLDRLQAHLQGTIDTTKGGDIGGSGKAMLNVPVIPDQLAVRGVFIYRRDAGYIDNIGVGRKDANKTLTEGGRIEATWAPTPSTTINYLFLQQRSNTDDNGYRNPTLGDLKKRTFILEPYNFDTLIHNLRLDQDVGFGTITATATYHKKTQSLVNDFTSVFGGLLPGVVPITNPQMANSKGRTFEVRLASTPGRRFEYLIGAFHDSTREDFIVKYFGANAAQVIDAIFGAPLGTLSAPGGVFSDNEVPFRGQETAIFGEATFHFSDQLKATIGGRQFFTKSENQSISKGFFNLLTAGTLSTTLTGRQKESGFTPKASLTWTPNSDFMAYALVSKGFRFGGPNVNPSTPGSPIPPTFGSDSLINYELGARSNLFGNRLQLDATAFYIDWRDIQLRLTAPNRLSYAANAGKAKIYGAEVTAKLRVTSGLLLQTNVTYLNATLEESFNPGGGQPIAPKGTPLPGASKWQVSNILSYDWSSGPLRPTFLFTHRYISGANSGIAFSIPQGGYNQFDGRATLHLNEAFDFTLFANNIGDSRGVTTGQSFGTAQQYILRPRRFGVTLDYKM